MWILKLDIARTSLELRFGRVSLSIKRKTNLVWHFSCWPRVLSGDGFRDYQGIVQRQKKLKLAIGLTKAKLANVSLWK